MSISLESLATLANTFSQKKIIANKQNENYIKAKKALKANFQSQIDCLPEKVIDLNRIKNDLKFYDKKVFKKVAEWAKKFQKDNKLEIKDGESNIILDDTLLMHLNSEFKNIKESKEYKELKEAKREYKAAIKILLLQKRHIENIEGLLKMKEVPDIAIKKAKYWYKYKV